MLRTTTLLLATVILIASCSGGDSAGESELLGEDLFNAMVVGGKAGCASCHSIEAGVDGIGPSLAGVGARAATRVSGMAGDAYLRQSITDPNAHVVEGYNAGVMPQGFDLSEAQIDSLVEYLSGL